MDIKKIRGLQKKANAAVARGKTAAGDLLDSANSKLLEVDDAYRISEKSRDVGKRITQVAEELDRKHQIGETASKAKNAALQAGRNARAHTRNALEASGVTELAGKAGSAVENGVVRPVMARIEEKGLDQQTRRLSGRLEQLYGTARSTVKPYFQPETPGELLRKTRRELARAAACIMQVDEDQAAQLAKQFGDAVGAKLAGIVRWSLPRL